MLKKIITGSQTGVNRAVLDICRDREFPCGGWCSKGRLAEDGGLHKSYPLVEAKLKDDRLATELNILEGDGTLVLTRGRPTGCTAFPAVLARRRCKPLLVIDLLEVVDIETVVEICRNWIKEGDIEILNVAGPRESRHRGIYHETMTIMESLIP